MTFFLKLFDWDNEPNEKVCREISFSKKPTKFNFWKIAKIWELDENKIWFERKMWDWLILKTSGWKFFVFQIFIFIQIWIYGR